MIMPDIGNALTTGTLLLQQAQSRLDLHAGQLAQVAGATGTAVVGTAANAAGSAASATLIESLIGLQQAETYALSGLKVIQAADNAIGTLLDIRA
jgi:hypothetical protein